jgi:type I restriction enzyme S subunit
VRVRIYFKELGRLKVALPPIEEQRRIAEALRTLDDELAQLRQLHDALKEQKKGLMQKLLTGQVRVPASMMKEAAHA